MDKKTIEYLITLYSVTLNSIYPHYADYPYEEIKAIIENEGDESEKLNIYTPYIMRVFWLRYNLERLNKEIPERK